MLALYIVLGVIAVVVLYIVGAYNGLVRLRQHVRESWSAIDTELRRRYDLIPNLVETVKGYAGHEREALEAVIAARNSAVASTGSPEEQARDENVLVGALRQLFAVVEAYPDLKANQSFLDLQRQLANTEDRLQASRRFYNANVRALNTRIEVFPSNLIASWFRFRQEEFFEIEDAAMREAPSVSFTE
ncbi:MAG: LemA family protein [Candidatus Bipolaricaulota bacterium]|nr:MAG: LemA family protein [Candidatus Bipolaricaulota bacterium]